MLALNASPKTECGQECKDKEKDEHYRTQYYCRHKEATRIVTFVVIAIAFLRMRLLSISRRKTLKLLERVVSTTPNFYHLDSKVVVGIPEY